MKHFIQSSLSLALLATACLSISHSAAAQTAKTARTAKAATAKTRSWIRVQAATDKQRYAVGEPIQVTLHATNIQSRDAYLKYSSGQRFELKLFKDEILRANVYPQKPIYTWSADKNFVMMESHIKLKSGQSETYRGEIGSEMGALTPGLYRLEAQLSNSSQISAPAVSFTVAAADTTAPNAPAATLSATTDKSVYDVGEAVKVDFSLTNNAGALVTLEFNSGQTYDVLVRDAAGETVWNWAANKRFIMATRQVALEPNERQNYSVQWDGRALPGREIGPGQYTIEAIYSSNLVVRAAPVPIEIR